MAGDVREWQPIATAPKDGTNILVCREMEDRSVGEAFFWEGAWRTWDGENHTRTSWIEGYLTHWRPMPGAFPAPTNRRIEMARMMFKQERVPPMSEGVPMTDTESKVLRDFLTSPLSVDDAVRRLVSLGYQEAVAEDLVEEWIEGAHSKEGI
jgi:hypothetical protein